jgi:hypothetical protein
MWKETMMWAKVKYGKTFSKYKQTKAGLPQGVVAATSTTLFNACINDLPNIVRNTKTNREHTPMT